MAYGLKYELHGKSVPYGKNWKVRISKEGYSGPQIDRNVPANPFVLKKDSAGTIRGTSLVFAIRSIADFEFIDLYTNNSKDWLIQLVDDSLGIGLITSIEPAPLVKVLGSFGGSDVYPTGSALNMMLSTANRVVNISENYGLKSGILSPQNALDWTDENNLPGWVGTNANAVLVKVGDPYMLVQAQYLSGYVSAGV